MSLIGRFEHLPKRPRSEEARPLLEKIASQVKPIMSKRGWKVGTLAEFLPANPALLGNNMNAGQRINLRLRPPGAESTFYDYEQLVLVMLHELTHIEHGPHDAKFYKLLAELEEEFYELKRRGYSGEGFHGTGHHLQGIKVNEYEGKVRGLAAAEKRLATARVIGKGGVLGGGNRDGRSMKEIIAEAAERRIRDDKACKTEDSGDVEAEVKKAQEESVGVDAVDLERQHEQDGRDDKSPGQPPSLPSKASSVSKADISASMANVKKREVIDLTDDELGPTRPISSSIIQRSNERVKKSAFQTSRTETTKQWNDIPPTLLDAAHDDSSTLVLPDGEWSCSTCTLINRPSASSCEACNTTRSRPVTTNRLSGTKTDQWWCEFCGAGPRAMQFWSCAECGWVRKWG